MEILETGFFASVFVIMYSQRVYQLFAKNRKKKDEIEGSRIAFVVSFLFCFFPLPFCSGVDITLLLSVPSTKRHELSGVSHKKKGKKEYTVMYRARSQHLSSPARQSLEHFLAPEAVTLDTPSP